MTERVYRPIFNDNEQVKASKLRRLAQSAWTAAATALWGARGAPAAAVFLGDGLKASPGAGLTVQLARGLALGQIVTGEEYTHDLRPMVCVSPLSVGIAANVGVDPRIDLIVVKAVEADEDSQSVYVKDPISAAISQVSRAQRTALGFVAEVVAGTPAAIPSAPAVPAGYAAVAEVLVAPAAGAFLASDITDRRALDALTSGELKARAGKLQLGDNAAGATLRRFASALSPFATGDVALLTNAWASGAADARLHVGELVASTAARVAQLRGSVNPLPVRDSAGTARIGIDAFNTPFAYGIYDSSGGFVAGYNAADMTSESGNIIRLTFTTPAPNGNRKMVQVAISSTLNPSARVAVDNNAAYVDVQPIDASGAAVALTGRIYVMVYLNQG